MGQVDGVFGNGVVAEGGFEQGDDLLQCGGWGVVGGDDDGGDALSEVLVGEADSGAFFDAGMGIEGGF